MENIPITKKDLDRFKFEIIEIIKKLSGENHNLKRWLKSKEVCELLGISVNTLKAMRVDFNPSLIMGTYYYDYDTIVNVMEQKRVVTD